MLERGVLVLEDGDVDARMVLLAGGQKPWQLEGAQGGEAADGEVTDERLAGGAGDLDQLAKRRMIRVLTVQNPVSDKKGTAKVELPAEIFDVDTNVALIHQVVVAQLAAARQGTHATKTRGEVRGGGVKPYRQKGTGRARQGSIRAPQFTGGGTVHGPQPRSYDQRTPKKMKAAALRGALSDRARNDRVFVVSALVDGDTPTWLIGVLVYVYGCFTGLQYTTMNTLAYTDVDVRHASMASSMASTTQYLSISFGIAFASLLMEVFVGREVHAAHAYVAAFHITVLVLAAVTAMAATIFLCLRPDHPGAPARAGTAIP